MLKISCTDSGVYTLLVGGWQAGWSSKNLLNSSIHECSFSCGIFAVQTHTAGHGHYKQFPKV
jgi:hypothetical protein